MGKKQEDHEEEMSSESPHKKHKKHKKHKHKRRREGEEGDLTLDDTAEDIDITGSPPPQPAIKLKIKIAGTTLSTKSIPGVANPASNDAIQSAVPVSSASSLIKPPTAPGDPRDDVFKTKKKGDDTSDEELEWLDALEAGRLDDNGELKKDKDESLLTTRQKALLHGKTDGGALLELPTGYKKEELTEEQLDRRLQRAKKRREQAQEKREKDKKQTLDRLLKKQDSKCKGNARGKGQRKTQGPGFRYSNNKNVISISVPPGLQFPFPAKVAPPAPLVVRCGVVGCGNAKKYACTKTGVPLCSLECYKKNLSGRSLQGPQGQTAVS